MIKEHDRVRVLEEVTPHPWCRKLDPGEEGTVIAVHAGGEGVTVEFGVASGEILIATLPAKAVEKV